MAPDLLSRVSGRARARRELILTFHGLGGPPTGVSDSERKVWVPAHWLEAVLEALPRQDVSLAFDDGNVSDVEYALPALIRREHRARFFVLAGQLGRPGRVTVSDVLSLRAAGMRIGSHGLHHCDWRTLGDDELDAELTGSRRALSELVGAPIEEAACPFGSYDRRVLKAIRAAGYARAYTSDGGCSPLASRLAARTSVTSDRPLEHWLALVAAGPSDRPDPVLLAKRYAKRLR